MSQRLENEAIRVLKAWLLSDDHFSHPYPTSQQRHELAKLVGISPQQVRNWFVNARKRIWQPLLVEMGASVDQFLVPGRKSPVAPCSKQDLRTTQPLHNARMGIRENKRRHEEIGSPSSSSSTTTLKNMTTGHGTTTQLENDNPGSLKQPKLNHEYLRKGQWTKEEEIYVNRLISAFENGLLDIPERTTLRHFLASRLSCDPMRISKKFNGEQKIGKMCYKPKKCSLEQKQHETLLLEQLQDDFKKSIHRKSLYTFSQDCGQLTSLNPFTTIDKLPPPFTENDQLSKYTNEQDLAKYPDDLVIEPLDLFQTNEQPNWDLTAPDDFDELADFFCNKMMENDPVQDDYLNTLVDLAHVVPN